MQHFLHATLLITYATLFKQRQSSITLFHLSDGKTTCFENFIKPLKRHTDVKAQTTGVVV